MTPILETASGRLFEMDCLNFLATLDDNSVDLGFADPPFNLGKNTHLTSTMLGTATIICNGANCG